MRTWVRHCVWTTAIVLLAATACGGDDETKRNTGGDGDGDAASGGMDSGDGDVGDGDASGGSPIGDGDGTGGTMTVEMTGSSCETVDDCYPRVAVGELSGEAMCLDRVQDGYCTHECQEDMDCCAAEGECESELSQVCAPFSSLDVTLCFLSCEDAEVEAAGYENADEFCAEEANPDFGCRSTGGGQANRRVCMPTGPLGMGGMNAGGAMNLGGGAGSTGR